MPFNSCLLDRILFLLIYLDSNFNLCIQSLQYIHINVNFIKILRVYFSS